MYDDQSAKARMERETYARDHPIRARILELYEEEPGRSLTAADLQSELDDLPRSTLAAVAYHVQVLRKTDLLPEAAG
jgi:hypothetical protein